MQCTQFAVLTETAWFIVCVCPLQRPPSFMEQAVLLLNRAEYAASTRSNASAARTARYNSSTLFIPIFEFLPKDKWNGAVLHCVEYSWRLRWNERLMKDLYPLGLLTSPMTSGISWSWFGKSGMKVKMFNLAVRCTGCGCRCSAV